LRLVADCVNSVRSLRDARTRVMLLLALKRRSVAHTGRNVVRSTLVRGGGLVFDRPSNPAVSGARNE
jgi:hypothetical protein